MQVIEDRGVLVRVKKPEPILHAIKQSRYIKDNGDETHDVLVKWTLPNVRRLANMGLYQTPSPILRDYDWPGALRPFDHQKTTASFLTANNRAFCFSEQGTSKTAATVWAADYLMSIGDIKRARTVAKRHARRSSRANMSSSSSTMTVCLLSLKISRNNALI